jgi:acetyl-CoA carboxylase carboxyltransferase component
MLGGLNVVQGKYDIEKQHKMHKLHAIERIKYLLDDNSFHEYGSNIGSYGEEYECEKSFPYDGVITGYGYIHRKLVFIYSQDFTVCGGTVGKAHGRKIAITIKKAIENKCPVIGICDSGGARIQEGVNALAGYGDIFFYNTLASGYIPQISIIAGTCAGGAVYSPAITDFIFMIKNVGYMFVTGPKVIQDVTGKICSMNELGGSSIHAEYSGVAHFISETEKECFNEVRKLIKMIPSSNILNKNENFKFSQKYFSQIGTFVPKEQRKVYDIHRIIDELLDKNTFMEIQKKFAGNIVIGLGTFCGMTVGIVANQPKVLGGVLDSDASDKAARFVRYCDSFNIPIITLVDVPGFVPSIEQEKSGIIRHGAKLLYAYAESTVPKITLILRKAFGGAYIAMGSKHLGADAVYAWPNVQISVMGAEGAIDILYGKILLDMGEKEKEIFKEKMEKKYSQKYMNSLTAEKEGYIDEIILPEETREKFYQDLVAFTNKEPVIQVTKKHGNIPL